MEAEAEPQVAMSAEATSSAMLGLPPITTGGVAVTVSAVGAAEKVARCGDGTCAPSETPSATEDLPDACEVDCPFKRGACPSPGSTEAGDSGQVCLPAVCLSPVI